MLERYLGPIIDVDAALTEKILKSNGQNIHQLTYRALTPNKIQCDVEKKA